MLVPHWVADWRWIAVPGATVGAPFAGIGVLNEYSYFATPLATQADTQPVGTGSVLEAVKSPPVPVDGLPGLPEGGNTVLLTWGTVGGVRSTLKWQSPDAVADGRMPSYAQARIPYWCPS